MPAISLAPGGELYAHATVGHFAIIVLISRCHARKIQHHPQRRQLLRERLRAVPASLDHFIWSYRHIEYIAGEEVAGGYFDGLYHPEYTVARDQMAVFITRAFELE